MLLTIPFDPLLVPVAKDGKVINIGDIIKGNNFEAIVLCYVKHPDEISYAWLYSSKGKTGSTIPDKYSVTSGWDYDAKCFEVIGPSDIDTALTVEMLAKIGDERSCTNLEEHLVLHLANASLPLLPRKRMLLSSLEK